MIIMKPNNAFIITREACQKNNISPEEVLFLASIVFEPKFQKTIKSLEDKGYLIKKTQQEINLDGLDLTYNGAAIIDAVTADSQITGTKEEKRSLEKRLENLAMQLKDIFPKGRKDGTTKQWSEGVKLITQRLLLFFKQYGDYTDEQILEAARSYVEGFNGDYTFMHTLKYFIFKNDNVNGTIDRKSELLTYIENAGQEDTLRQDWTSELV